MDKKYYNYVKHTEQRTSILDSGLFPDPSTRIEFRTGTG